MWLLGLVCDIRVSIRVLGLVYGIRVSIKVMMG